MYQRLSSLLMVFFVVGGLWTQAQTGDDIPPPPPADAVPPIPERPTPTTTTGLAPAVAALAQPGINDALSRYGSLADVVRDDRATVVIRTADTDRAGRDVRANRGRVLRVLDGLLVAEVPVSRLQSLGRSASVINISLPEKPTVFQNATQADAPQQGAIVSQGVSFMNADAWQAAGYNGQGVKIGVIDVGFDGFNNGETLCALAPVFWNGNSYIATGQDHGTAVVETVCDVAPSALVYPVSISNELTFVNATEYLTDTVDVDIIVASLGFYQTPADGETSLSAQAVEDAVNTHGVIFALANGNGHRGHHESAYDRTYHPSGNYYTHGFNAGQWGATVDRRTDGAVDFLPSGTRFAYVLKWNEWNVVPQSDFDLLLYRWNPNIGIFELITGSQNINAQTGLPYEEIGVSDEDGYELPFDGWYRLMILERQVTGTPWIELQEANIQVDIQYPYGFSSVTTPATANEAFSVSAVNYMTGLIENYSSAGPANTLYGNAPLPNGYFQPQIAGPARTNTQTRGQFFGTSAAAPHVGGASALVLSAYPTWTNAQVQNFLTSNAQDAGDSGADYRYGAGIIRLPAPPTTAPPTNNDISSAVVLGAGDLPYTQTVDNSTATIESGEPTYICATIDNSVWYRVSVPVAVDLAVTTLNTGEDTVIHVFNTSFNSIACNDNTGGTASRVVFPVAANTTYYVSVGSKTGGGTIDTTITLAYDTTADGIVAPTDGVYLLNRLGGGYNRLWDMNRDGQLTQSDVQIIQQNFGQALP